MSSMVSVAAWAVVAAGLTLLFPGSAPGQPAGGGVNMLQNGAFVDGMNAWQFNLAPPASALPDSGGGELCVSIADGGVNAWDITVFQKYLPLENGATYRIQYDARATAGRTLDIKTGMKAAPWTTYSYHSTTLTTVPQSFAHTFTMASATDTCANLEFHLGGQGAIDVCFDNVVLEKTSAGGSPPATPPGAPGAETLRGLAQPLGVRIGAMLNADEFWCEPPYTETLAREFNRTVTENVLKFEPLRPDPGTFAFRDPDAILDFAEANSMELHGHTLVWHEQLPAWLTGTTHTATELKNILQDHVQTVVGRYAGRIPTWDVVSEAIDDNGALRNTFWLQGIGSEYIDLAFQWAHAADPGAVLIYNDYGIADLGAKSDAVYALVADMVQRGVPVHGVGFQSHLNLSAPATADVAANMARYAALGIDVYISEIDVALQEPPTQTDLAQQAQIYAEMLLVCLAAENCADFVAWGVTDLHSWIPIYFPGMGSALLFDASYNPKPAYDTLIDVLRGAASPIPALSMGGAVTFAAMLLLGRLVPRFRRTRGSDRRQRDV